MSIKWNYLRNFSCFCRERILIKSSADIFAVDIQLTLIRSIWTFCLSQCRWISTCFNFVSSFNIFLFRILRIRRLSHSMWSFFMKSNRIDSKNRLHQIIFFAIRNRINNFASILNVIIVACFAILQSIELSYNLNK